jgi:hypothetical protein
LLAREGLLAPLRRGLASDGFGGCGRSADGGGSGDSWRETVLLVVRWVRACSVLLLLREREREREREESVRRKEREERRAEERGERRAWGERKERRGEPRREEREEREEREREERKEREKKEKRERKREERGGDILLLLLVNTCRRFGTLFLPYLQPVDDAGLAVDQFDCSSK